MFPIKNVKRKLLSVLIAGGLVGGQGGGEKWEVFELRSEGLQDQEVVKQRSRRRGTEEKGGGVERESRGQKTEVREGTH